MLDHQHAAAIGARLRQARLTARLTQQDVARDFLRSRQAISSWEGGKTLPSLLEFKELASLYGVSTDQLLFGVEDVSAECKRVLANVRSAQKVIAAPR